MKKFLLLIIWSICFETLIAQKIKVACVGNSVTYGYLLENREETSYPAQLQKLLGPQYEVMNFGKSGATLLQKGHRPYNAQKEFEEAVKFAGDKVIIHLGLNDTDPRNWPNYGDEFVKDYLRLIDTFRQVNKQCEVFICRLTPIAHRHTRFQSGTRDWYWMIQKKIEEVARIASCELIDLQEELYKRPDLLPDALHPNAEGAALLAQTVYSALTGDFGGLQMPTTYSDNMVLQRDEPLCISGKANAGERITVKIGKHKKTTVTERNGKWSVTFDPMKASVKPTDLIVSGPSSRLKFQNVLIGDVWLCSGQSNMVFRVDESAGNEQQLHIETARQQPPIRLFAMRARWETTATEWKEETLDSLNKLQYYHTPRWSMCDSTDVMRFSAIAFSFGKMLNDSLQVPIGLILNAVGGSPTESWIDRKSLEFEFPNILYNWRTNDFIQDWVRGRASLNIKRSNNPLQRHPYEPCYLYEAGILPLCHYPIKGIIWYQGESNAHNIETHERLFPILIKSWRDYWKKELPFYYVQLSSLNRPSWPHFRDSQRQLLQSIPHTGMAVSSDRGDSLNVHPVRKKEIGERLARLALSQTYHHNVVPSGPLFKSIQLKADTVIVSFDYADGLTTSDGKAPATFEIATHDGLYYPAQSIICRNQIKLWNKQVKNPHYVRYGWQPFTRANLINKEGLPASTFKATDRESESTDRAE